MPAEPLPPLRPDQQPSPECPFCDNERDLERRGHEWFCPCCSKCWLAWTNNDKRLLKTLRISQAG